MFFLNILEWQEISFPQTPHRFGPPNVDSMAMALLYRDTYSGLRPFGLGVGAGIVLVVVSVRHLCLVHKQALKAMTHRAEIRQRLTNASPPVASHCLAFSIKSCT